MDQRCNERTTKNGETIFDFLRNGEVGSRIISFTDGQPAFEAGDPATDLFLVEAVKSGCFNRAAKGQGPC